MLKTYQLNIQRVDNGFTVQSNPDDRPRLSLVAKDEKEVVTILTDLATHLFDPIQPPKSNAPTIPSIPTAQT